MSRNENTEEPGQSPSGSSEKGVTMTDFREKYLERRAMWLDWYGNKATPAQKKLFDLILDYSDEYFSDFRFESGSVINDFVQVEGTDDNGDSYTEIMDGPDELRHFNNIILKSFQYEVAPLEEGTEGCINPADWRVTVIPQMVNDDEGKPSILHEIIHMYEVVINELPRFYHDILLVCLYRNLREKVPDLDDRILSHTHVYVGNEITLLGGEHDILFFLKSIDLDLRCGYKLGTVCGYGRDQY